MLTIVCYPKPFVDNHIKTIQTNAICSWKQIEGDTQIVLIGGAGGVGEFAEQHGIECLDIFGKDEDDVLLFGELLLQITKRAKFETICFVNGDIILPTTFARTVARAKTSTGMLLGTRTNLDVRHLLDFSCKEWEAQLHHEVRLNGRPMRAGADFFVFRKGYFGTPHPIYVGRPGIDNWIIWYGRQKGIVCDLTPSVLAIHQNHRAAGEWESAQKQEESIHNVRSIGEWRLSYGPSDATHEFSDGVVVSRRLRALLHRAKMGHSIVKRRLRGMVRLGMNWLGGKRPNAKLTVANGTDPRDGA